MPYTTLTALLAAAVLSLAGVACDGAEETSTRSSTASPKATLPDGLMLTTAPQEARSVSEVRQASDGEKVVVRGVVAGRVDPIADNRAILTLLDESVSTCDKNPSDSCATPWDACCEPQEVIARNSATVQIVDGEGRPLKASLKGLGTLAPLSRVVVVGTYRPTADGQAAVINATGIFVEPQAKAAAQ